VAEVEGRISVDWEKKAKRFNLVWMVSPFIKIISTLPGAIWMVDKGVKFVNWGHVLSVLVVIILFIALYAPIIPWWIRRCLDPDGLYSYAFLIPTVSAWLLWQDRTRLFQVPRQLCPRAMGLVVAGLFLQLLGVFVEVRFIVFLSLVVVFIGLIWMWLGTAFVRMAWFPLAFLFFAVPLDPILVRFSAILQILSARLAGTIVGLMGIPVMINGAQLTAQGFGVLVIHECNGLQYTISLLASSTLIATHISGILEKAILVLSALPIAIVANSIRITTVMLIGQFWGKEAAVRFYHTFSGVLVFGIALAMLMGLAVLVRYSTSSVIKGAKVPDTKFRQLGGITSPFISFRSLNGWVAVLLGLSILLRMGIQRVYDVPYVIDLKGLVPAVIKGWRLVDEDVSHNEKEKSWVLWRTYENSNRQRLALHTVATFGWRGIRDYEACLVSSGWNPIARKKVLLRLRDDTLSEVYALWMSKPNNARLLSLYVYLSNGEPTINFYRMVWRSLMCRHSKNWLGTLRLEVRIITDDRNADEAFKEAKEFLTAVCQPLANLGNNGMRN